VSDSGGGFPNPNASPPAGPWPSEAEIEHERRLISLEQGQNRSNQLLMQLQLEYRKGSMQLNQRVTELTNTVTSRLDTMTDLLKKFLSNGH
jgi:hypothetical protein